MLMELGRQVIASNKVETQEEYLTLPSGDRVFLATKGPLQGSDGEVIGIFGISRDITDFKRAEAGLQEREGLFRALVEQSLAGIYIIQRESLAISIRGLPACLATPPPTPCSGWGPCPP